MPEQTELRQEIEALATKLVVRGFVLRVWL